jgi:hypothetical protein
MCGWEQFCRFAREPERRKLGADARVTIDGSRYELEPDMASEHVVLLWGLFDDELCAEFDGERFGPYRPVDGRTTSCVTQACLNGVNGRDAAVAAPC